MQRVGYAYQIAINNIAEEVANVAIRHGSDPRDFSLVAYGAAGPMLLASALDTLNVKRVIVPPHPGLFSALGLLSTDLVFSDSRSRYLMLSPDSAPSIAAIFDEMERKLREAVGDAAQGATVRRSFDGRLLGQTWETPFVDVPEGPIDAATIAAMTQAFHAEYARRNGLSMPMIPVQGVSYRVQLVLPAAKVDYPRLPDPAPGALPESIGSRTLRELGPTPVEALIYDREQLPRGARVAGPAIIQEALCTTLVGPGQQATVGALGELYIEKTGEAA
jgi:N-methylhydantoinase A